MASKWEVVDLEALVPPSTRGRGSQFTLKKLIGRSVVLANFVRESAGSNGTVIYKCDVYDDLEADSPLGTVRLPQAFGKKVFTSLSALPANRRSQLATPVTVNKTDKGSPKLEPMRS